MPDPVQTAAGTAGALAVGRVVVASAKIVLGPAAQEVAEALGRSAAYRLRNFGRMTDMAERKLGAAASEPGSVPLRVAGPLAESASWCDNDLILEYFAGVLAASRTEAGDDDRGARWSSLLAQMSAYEVRTHYIIYRALRERQLGTSRDFGPQSEHRATVIHFSADEYLQAFEAPKESFADIADHSLAALKAHDLVDQERAAATLSDEQMRDFFPTVAKGGLAVRPSHTGMLLYLWAHGHRTSDVNMLFSEHLNFEVEPTIAGAGTGEVSAA